MGLFTISGLCAALLGFLSLGWRTWNFTMGGRKQKIEEYKQQREEELKGFSKLRQYDEMEERPIGKGTTAFAFIGGFASSVGRSVLKSYDLIGVDNDVAPILLLELNRIARSLFLTNIPPRFIPRITAVDCPNLPTGIRGATSEEAEAMRHLWYQSVQSGIQPWFTQLDSQENPHDLLIIVLSTGGHAALLPTVLWEYHTRYPDKPVYIVTILNHIEVRREQFGSVASLLEDRAKVSGSIIMDNLRDHRRADFGISLLFGAMTGGRFFGDFPSQIVDALGEVFPSTRTVRYTTIATWFEMMAVTHWNASCGLDEVYAGKDSLIEEKMMRGIKEVIKPEHQSLALEPASPGHTRRVYVIAPLEPKALNVIVNRVNANIEKWRMETDRNMLISYVSIATHLTPQTTEVPIAVVLLQPLADDGSELHECWQEKQQQSPKSLIDMAQAQ